VVRAQFCGAEGPGSNPAQDKNFHLWIEVVFHLCVMQLLQFPTKKKSASEVSLTPWKPILAISESDTVIFNKKTLSLLIKRSIATSDLNFSTTLNCVHYNNLNFEEKKL
jgi:hypothetical protein